jgi:DNA-binding IclR family transcriptional regulator
MALGAMSMPPTRDQVLLLIEKHPEGLMTQDICRLTGIPGYSASSKLSKLFAYGLIERYDIAKSNAKRWKPKAQKVTS